MDENKLAEEEMDETEEEEVITCPVCGEEVEPGTENCPLCGAPVGALENKIIAGTAIDNSAAIDAMLQSAAMLVEESASLGVELDDDDDEEEDEDDGAEQEEYADNGTEPPPAEAPNNITAVPGDLTDEQKSKLEAGGLINLNTGIDDAPPPVSAAKKAAAKKKKKEAKPPKPPKPPKAAKEPKEPKAPAEAPVLYEMDEQGNAITEDDNRKAARSAKKAKKPKEQKKSGKSASAGLVFVTAFVALLLGCAVGFFTKLVMFPDVVIPDCQKFAQRAVQGVNSVTDEELYIAEAYVRDSEDATQCIFRAFSVSNDVAESRWFRVKVYNDAPETIRIYFQLDMKAYEAMINSDDAEQRIQASMLMNNQQELERCISEIQSGKGWSTASAPMLNEALHPTPVEEK